MSDNDALTKAEQARQSEIIDAVTDVGFVVGNIEYITDLKLAMPLHLPEIWCCDITEIRIIRTRYTDGESEVQVKGWAYPLRKDGQRKQREHAYWIWLPREVAHKFNV